MANILDSDNSQPKNISDNFLESLCVSIDDALNCTSDIIDEDCSEEQGKNRFDKWNMALVNTYYELCDYNGKDDKILLRAILYTVHCWNATHFVECMQTNTQFTSIGNLMHIDINKNECDKLYLTFEECRKKQTELTKRFCTQNETTEAVSLVHHLLDIFMESSHCIEYYFSKSNSCYNTYYHSIIFVVIYHFAHSVILSLNRINISNESNY